jgi:hypothetical protein
MQVHERLVYGTGAPIKLNFTGRWIVVVDKTNDTLPVRNFKRHPTSGLKITTSPFSKLPFIVKTPAGAI